MKIINIISNDWGAYVDIRALYQSLARRVDTIHLDTHGDCWNSVKDDPQTLVVSWDITKACTLSHDNRRCRLGLVYNEAMTDDEAQLMPWHHEILKRFKTSPIDFVFGHTPWMVSKLNAIHPGKAFLLPVGWDAEAMGTPRWDAPKHHLLAYHGSMAGRREVLLPYFHSKLGSNLKDISGAFGRQLLGALDVHAASFYVAHSRVKSFSTWRAWQCASTSAALIAEGLEDSWLDCWPFGPESIAVIPEITVSNAPAMAELVCNIARSDQAMCYAHVAHDIARRYTIDEVYSKFLLPAAEEILRR
jgi:hypothetical protein